MTVRVRDTLFLRFVVLLVAVLGLCQVIADRGRAPEPAAALPPPAAGPAWRALGPLPRAGDAADRLFLGPWQDPWPVTPAAIPVTAWTDGWANLLLRALLVVGAAWWGTRWLTSPMRRIAAAADALPDAIGGHVAAAPLDEHRGAAELRDAAHRFNTMARRLDTRFRDRGLFVAAISHDLRAPLARVRLRLEAFEHEPLVRRCVADLHEMNELVDTVLEVFRADQVAEARTRTDLRVLLHALRDDLVEQGHAVTVRGPSAEVAVQTAALRRALTNLVGNAVRHGQRADIALAVTDAAVTVCIDDAGPGIPPERLDTVFEPFFRMGDVVPGSGLGLYIARELLQRQGATVALSNRPEGGLRATVVLTRPRHAPGRP